MSMPTNSFNDSLDQIARLVSYFTANRADYLARDYKEAQVRVDLINPFFIALGWDVHNSRHVAPQDRPVVVEATQEVEGALRAPDYAFRIGQTVRYYTEAKKIGVSIKNDSRPAYQLRSYAWSAKLPLSLLTDFEELSVYDCRFRPFDADKVTTARINYYTFDQYPERWREIWDVFSYDALLSGAFDAYAQAEKPKRGTSEVDDEFLKEIERWRNDLARNIAIRNPTLSIDEMNDAVQRTLDRIVFLRIAEDRGIESYGQLQAVAKHEGIYPELLRLFRLADARYNSGLFNFSTKGDQLTPRLSMDDKLLRGILNDLYFPHSPYRFNVMPVEILGNVYEQFLGKVIRLTAAHQAKVEEKPEVKKAGGVYYTPAYIVDYIVKHTVGQKLADKDPRQISDLRVLDMACGSGSFLLGAYDFLLDWYLQWYIAHDPTKRKMLWRKDESSEWKLTLDEKKRILTSHIYGVDIDRQAVEVTKLSLLLKVLEGESDATLSPQLPGMAERVLPNLDANIKCGNSLIGNDYFAGQLTPDADEMRRVNAFDWEAEFPEIMRRGGFDCVIGNPPYVRQETLGEQKQYFQQHFKVYHGMADLYAYFIERGVSLLRDDGLFSFIVANKWMRANYGEPLRRWLKAQHIEEIIDFGDLPVFEQATTYPCILRIHKGVPPAAEFAVTQPDTLDFLNLSKYVQEHAHMVKQTGLDDAGWALVSDSVAALLTKLRAKGMPLGDYVQGHIYYGIKTGLNEAFVIDAETRQQLIAQDARSAELIKPFLMGRDIKRYAPPTAERYLIFTRRGVNLKNYPAIEKHLLQYKDRLMPKPANWKGGEWTGRKPGTYKWYEIQDTVDYFEEFEKPKIIVPAIVQNASYVYDTACFYSNDKTCIIQTGDLYLVGVLNSKVPDVVMHQISSTKQGGYFEYKPMYVSQLPIRTINFDDPADKARHDRMVALVMQMLELHKRLPAARTDHDRQLVQRQIDSADRQIDALVYELYGLTDEEIAIVEGRN